MRNPKFRRLTALGIAAVVAAVPAITMSTQAAADNGSNLRRTYIVQLADNPIATYTGGVDGIPASKPAPGTKVDVKAANSVKYAAYLAGKHSETLKAAGVPADRKTLDYNVVFNGFAASLTATEAASLRERSEVQNLWRSEIRTAAMTNTPDYLGLTGAAGVWAKQVGGQANAGRGIIIGDIDTGIDSHHPFFAPKPGEVKDPDFKGICDKGADATFECNSKIIGARWSGKQYGNDYNEGEEISAPTDRQGHGSHTAGTAAGNANTPVVINGRDMGKASGVAPAAQLAIYKGLWLKDGRGIGESAGLLVAINDAVADGVDIINYSISGSSTSIVTPETIAFMHAADAGVFAATAGGNDGVREGVSSVNHNSPWTMTVAASTHDRAPVVRKVTLGNGATYEGAGLGKGVASAPLVYAAKAGVAGADAEKLAKCLSDTDDKTDGKQGALDPEKVKGKIVICDRGINDRVDKSLAVKLAGGVGMILANLADDQSLNTDEHHVPTAHVKSSDGDAIKAYENTDPKPTAALSDEYAGTKPVAPEMADFSSFGPALAGGGDLIKPDITAPGVDIISSIPGKDGKHEWSSFQGTSMATPHIAGLAALMYQAKPTWGPMRVKSAMMTTARVTNSAGKPIMRQDKEATPLNYGAGEVVPTRMFDPGLVYDSQIDQWKAYACSIWQWQRTENARDCRRDNYLDPSDMNYPTISVGDLAGKQTVTRTVTNVGKAAATYTADVKAPAGVTMTVSPKRISLAPGEARTFTVTFTRTTAARGEGTFGSLTWSDGKGGHSVRSNVAIRPAAFSAPREAMASGRTGQVRLMVGAGEPAHITTSVEGLDEGKRDELKGAAKDGTDDIVHKLTVPAGTLALKVATYADDTNVKDLDMTVYRIGADGTRVQVGASANGGSNEAVILNNPEPGEYEVALDVFSGEKDATVGLHSWLLGNGKPARETTVVPREFDSTPGKFTEVRVMWSGVLPNKHLLGLVKYKNGDKLMGTTLLAVES